MKKQAMPETEDELESEATSENDSSMDTAAAALNEGEGQVEGAEEPAGTEMQDFIAALDDAEFEQVCQAVEARKKALDKAASPGLREKRGQSLNQELSMSEFED